MSWTEDNTAVKKTHAELLKEFHDFIDAWPKEPAPVSTDKTASNCGHGTDDTLSVVRILEQHNIPCCMVGVSALVFYGANRVRSVSLRAFACFRDSKLTHDKDWEICVPTELVDTAAAIFQSEKYNDRYQRVEPYDLWTQSLLFSYPRFQSVGIKHWFILVPADDLCLKCEPSNFIHSVRGLPYPRLDIFINTILERHDMLELEDVIDGTDVTEAWGKEHLDLSGTYNNAWAQAIQARGEMLGGGRWGPKRSFTSKRGGPALPKSEVWKKAVDGKKQRMGWEWACSPEIFSTQYRIKDTPEPWTVLSELS